MDPGLLEAEAHASGEVGTPNDDTVSRQVRSLLASLFPNPQPIERRRDQRYPFARLIVLSAVAEDGATPLEETETYVVVGKQISERGLGFFHPDPLPHRRVIASMELDGERWVSVLLDVSWCRFTRYGWYESGGRFLKAVELPSGVNKAVAN